MSDTDIKVIGVKECLERLDALQVAVEKKILRKALRGGCKVALSKARQLIPVKTGWLKRSLKVYAGRRKKDSISIFVGAGKKFFQGPTFYGGMVEFGRNRLPLTSKGKRAGKPNIFKGDDGQWKTVRSVKMEGKGYIKQAYDSTKNEMLTVIVDTINIEIDKTVKELNPIHNAGQ